jgi:hypothetical protein
MSEKNLQTEIVKALEAGFNKHLNRSIVYSPFRLFFNLFKKSNPKSIERVRVMIVEDVLEIISALEGFSEAIFLVKQNQFTPKGKELLKKCYNIGIRILKNDLTVMLAFKALRDSELRQEIYQGVLEQVQSAVFGMLEAQPVIAGETVKVEAPSNDKSAS